MLQYVTEDGTTTRVRIQGPAPTSRSTLGDRAWNALEQRIAAQLGPGRLVGVPHPLTGDISVR